MDELLNLQTELQNGMNSHSPSSGEHKYYAKKLATLASGIQNLILEASIDSAELKLHALFYEAEPLRTNKSPEAVARLAEIEKEASAARADLLARKPRPTRRLFSNLSPPS